jgi:hypothetical protein
MGVLRACSVEWCEKPARRGIAQLCSGHGHRLRRYGDPEGGPNPRPKRYASDAVCAVEGCGKPRKTRDWCSMHYSRWKVHGDVDASVRQYGTYRITMVNGYIGVWAPGHPTAGDYGYALEHRYVLFELGVDIDGMHVHHIDHDKTNNDPSNLETMTASEHHRLHGKTPNSGQFQRKVAS